MADTLITNLPNVPSPTGAEELPVNVPGSPDTDGKVVFSTLAVYVKGTIGDATASVAGLATAAQITKLDGIEANADVTDAANVGSVIDGASAVTSLGDTDKLPVTQSGTLKSIAYSALKTLLNALYQPLSSVLSTYAGISPSSAIQSFLGSADSDAIQAQLGLGPLIDVTGATTLEVGKRYVVHPTSSYTITLPVSGVVVGTTIDLIRGTETWSAAPLTIDANGGTLDAGSGPVSSLDWYSPGWSPSPYAIYRITNIGSTTDPSPPFATTYQWQASIINAVPMSLATQAALRAGVGQSGGLAAYTATPTAYSLQSATTTVNVSSATAPTSGQVLTATSATAATWQTPSGGGGAVVAVKSAIKTDTQSLSASTWTDITGLSITYTPTSASNKILVQASIQGGSSAATCAVAYRLVRDSTAIGVADAASNRIQAGAVSYPAQDGLITTAAMGVLDSPATTSSTVYKVQFRRSHDSGTGTVYVNRSHSDVDATTYARTASTITISEVTP